MEPDYITVFVTAPTIEEGRKIGQVLVNQKLAACANILPGIVSIFSWEGETCEENEVLLIIKTRADLFDELSSVVRKEHSYDLPEVIAVPIAAGEDGYLRWIDQVTRQA